MTKNDNDNYLEFKKIQVAIVLMAAESRSCPRNKRALQRQKTGQIRWECSLPSVIKKALGPIVNSRLN